MRKQIKTTHGFDMWFSSVFSLGIKSHAHPSFIGYQAYELLMSFRRWKENWSTQRKTLRARMRTNNKLSPHNFITYSATFHIGGESALTTASSRHSYFKVLPGFRLKEKRLLTTRLYQRINHAALVFQ